ncbi:MAG: hypothetical protein AAGE01_07305 [Pseudomonadota bacterium]
MKRSHASEVVPVMKDDSNELPVPTVWRPIFVAVVKAFAERDYRLAGGVSDVAPVSEDTARQVEEYVRDYGEELVELPADTWATSISLWMGDRWDVLVDLWTQGEGHSDLVLSANVSESGDGFVFEINMVYVP